MEWQWTWIEHQLSSTWLMKIHAKMSTFLHYSFHSHVHFHNHHNHNHKDVENENGDIEGSEGMPTTKTPQCGKCGVPTSNEKQQKDVVESRNREFQSIEDDKSLLLPICQWWNAIYWNGRWKYHFSKMIIMRMMRIINHSFIYSPYTQDKAKSEFNTRH